MTHDELIEKMAKGIYGKIWDYISSWESNWANSSFNRGYKDIVFAQARAALQAIEDAGFVVVPKEPSDEMIAGALASTAYHHNFEAQLGESMSKLNVNREKIKIRYRAMLVCAKIAQI